MPKPQKHVFVCTQGRPPGHPRGSCAQHKSPELIETFLMELQNRALFDKIAVTNTGCMGPCTTGPSVLVYPEGVMYGGVTKEDVAVIFDEHLVGGQPVERLLVSPEIWG